MIISTQELKASILERNPKADTTIVDELCFLVRKYDLKWIPNTKFNNGAYFIMSQVSEAKGLSSDNYKDNWSTGRFKNAQSDPLSGKDLKLVGDELINLKVCYEQRWGKKLGRAGSILVGDWKRTYAYLVQGSTQAAKDFQSLGSSAIETSVKKEIEESTHTIEPDLQKQLIELTAYSNVGLKFEVAILDSFNPGSHRRWDFVERLPKVVKVYELKARTLSEQDVKATLVDKKYIELALEKYPNKSIEFIFTSPKGINWEAKNYIEEVNDNAKKLYPNAKVKVSFIDLQSITERVINNIVDNSPIESHFWLLKKLREEFTATVSSRTITKLNSSIAEAYQTGRLIKKAKVDSNATSPKLKSAQAA
ncbi:hypothetical protein [Nostoc sp. UHCC 0251]|uniref:hypothetical protein n=1 Tax=Nostoc sp. UHCC 0251 TaxID=3110240 RepID=UPI002B2005DB|nr:hypothetical protein [Nostoc sp. UHCC 0251]MEA5625303.1 hypothetical protein [Nostoc sp. UHCC 0251]